jgi:hypothetical protein
VILTSKQYTLGKITKCSLSEFRSRKGTALSCFKRTAEMDRKPIKSEKREEIKSEKGKI